MNAEDPNPGDFSFNRPVKSGKAPVHLQQGEVEVSQKSEMNRAGKVWEHLAKLAGGHAVKITHEELTHIGKSGGKSLMNEEQIGKSISWLVSAEMIRFTKVGKGTYIVAITGNFARRCASPQAEAA